MNNPVPLEYVTSFAQTNQALMLQLATPLLTSGEHGADFNRLAEVAQVPPPGAERRADTAAAQRDRQQERLHERRRDPGRHDPQQRPRRRQREQGSDAVARWGDRVGRGAVGTIPRRLGLLHPSFGGHQHAGARQAGAPAQVDVLGSGETRGVEPTELVEQVGPHEHGCVRHVEDVAHGVVLGLVELAGLDPRVRVAELVDAAPDLQQHLGIVGVDDLRADDAGVRPVGLLEHEAHHPRVEHDVVVANEEERGVPDGVERLVGRRREARLRHPADERVRQGTRDALAGILLRRRVDHEHCHARIVLAAQRPQRPLQPRSRVPGHDDGGDRRDLGAKRPTALVVLSPERLRAGRFPTRHDCGGAYNWPLYS